MNICISIFSSYYFLINITALFEILSTSLLIVQTILCLAGMLEVAIWQASSKSPEELKKISTKDLKDLIYRHIYIYLYVYIYINKHICCILYISYLIYSEMPFVPYEKLA